MARKLVWFAKYLNIRRVEYRRWASWPMSLPQVWSERWTSQLVQLPSVYLLSLHSAANTNTHTHTPYTRNTSGEQTLEYLFTPAVQSLFILAGSWQDSWDVHCFLIVFHCRPYCYMCVHVNSIGRRVINC